MIKTLYYIIHIIKQICYINVLLRKIELVLHLTFDKFKKQTLRQYLK